MRNPYMFIKALDEPRMAQCVYDRRQAASGHFGGTKNGSSGASPSRIRVVRIVWLVGSLALHDLGEALLQ